MAKASEKLAEALEVLHELQEKGVIAMRSRDISRTYRERLSKNGFLKEVMKGWYIASSPTESKGESTAWYASYWQFIAVYLNELKGNDWCLSPEQSLLLHVDNWTVPKQLIIRSNKANNNITSLLYDTTLLDLAVATLKQKDIVIKQNIQIYSLPMALVYCGPGFFNQHPTDARSALLEIRDASEVLEPLLEGEHTTIAGRLAGAFRNIGRDKIADEIIKTMRTLDYQSRENDPFENEAPLLSLSREKSPIVNRIRIMWQQMREPIIKRFPQSSGLPKNKKAYLKRIDEKYINDAYHSLSIEGYRVSRELIDRVRSGKWNPDSNKDDNDQVNAMAARGYWQAHQVVHKSIEKILTGENAGEILEADHSDWYRELFAPSVTAGLLKPKDLAGYRNSPVYIRNSMHVPPSSDSVRDAIPAFFELLKEENEPTVRVVLGHFIFVYIHPYMDGNGRMGRFLMNAMISSGGYPWTIVPVESRNAYMSALEEASVNQNIIPFRDYLANLIESEKDE